MSAAALPDIASRPDLSRILSLVVVAGLLAGVAATLFHAILTEPILDRAIAVEEAAATGAPGLGIAGTGGTDGTATHTHGGESVVSREVQHLGLWLGWGAVGVAWGTLVGGAYYLGWGRLVAPARTAWRVVIGVGAWFSFSALAFLKYPANPPAVGSPETVGDRMRYFVALEGVAVLLVIGGVALALSLWRRGTSGRVAGTAGLVLVVVGGLVAFTLFPTVEAADADATLSALIGEFRRHSFVGLLVFWAVFTAAFAWLPAWLPFRLHDADQAAPGSIMGPELAR